jgi:hypothetical protein
LEAETRRRLTVVQKRRQGGNEAEARRRQGEAETKRGQTVAATGSVILDRLTKALTFYWPRTVMP